MDLFRRLPTNDDCIVDQPGQENRFLGLWNDESAGARCRLARPEGSDEIPGSVDSSDLGGCLVVC